MRIVHLSWEYPPLVYGGLGRHVHALAEAQAAAGHDVTVLTQHAPSAPADDVVAGVRVVRVPKYPPLTPQSDLLAWVMTFNHALTRAGLELGPEHRPQLVHAHDWVTAHAGATLKHAYTVPLVATMHATEAGRHQGWLPGPTSRAIHTVEWWLTYEARRVISCSEHMRWEVTRLFEMPPGKADVIANGIDTTRWQATEEATQAARQNYAGDGPLLVFAGRLEYEKGVHTLLHAMPRLRRRFPGVRAVVVGQGTYRDELLALAARLRLGRSVRFTGWLTEAELAAVSSAADVAVVPSLYEPFGLVALEAAALGTPLVVAATGGLAEFVEDGRNGLTFAPDDPGALADAVSTVLRDEVLARRIAHTARTVLERDHSWVTIAARTVDTYRLAAVQERSLRHELAVASRPLHVAVADTNLLR